MAGSTLYSFRQIWSFLPPSFLPSSFLPLQPRMHEEGGRMEARSAALLIKDDEPGSRAL